jgi:hypothetical protein
VLDGVAVWTMSGTVLPSASATMTAMLTPLPSPASPLSLSLQNLQAVTGQDIAYMDSANFATSSVHVVDGNGTSIFTQNGGFPVWSITEKYLAYLSSVPQVNRHNFETDQTEAIGNNTTLILPRINGTFWDPMSSPNGSQVAFVSSRETDRVDIYVMNADRTDVRNLTSTSPDSINFLPAWSPDGQWIAFTSTGFDATSYRVRIIRVDGSGSIITVNTTPASALLPFWAGDGSRLAFWVITTDPTNPSFAMVTFNTSTGAIGSVQAFNPGTTDWGRVWIPGGGQYASMASFNPTTRVFQLLYSGDGSLIGTGWFPKWRPPTYEPWVIAVSPDALIPPIARETDQECPLLIDNTIPEQGIACALRTYREYGSSLTWTQLVALILHAEGNSLLISSTGCTDNTFPGIPAPLATSQPTPPAPIPVQVNFVPSPCNPTVHQEFVYAVVEQMFNKCDDPADVANDVGQCSEEGLLLFLGQVQRYRENRISDASTYAALAHQEIEHFINGTGGRVFGRCPCTTGNVRTVEEAQQGQVRNVNDLRYQAYEQTLYPRFWYSYSYFDNGAGAAPSFRYLKIY